MVVQTQERCHIVAGLHILVEDEDAVGDAVGELLLLCVQVVQRADMVFGGVIGHQVTLVQVLAVGDDLRLGFKGALPQIHAPVLHGLHFRRDDLAEDPVPGLDVRRDGGLGRVDGVIVAQNGGGFDLRVGEVVGGHVQLLDGAEHTVGGNAAQLPFGDLHPAGEQGVVQRRGDQIAHMHVPGAGADLDRLTLSHVDLGHQHVVGVGVLFDGQNSAHLHIFHLLAQILGDLHLGAGDGHGLGKGLVVDFLQGQINKLIQPFS